MKRLAKKTAWLALPILLWAIFILLLDPFNFFPQVHLSWHNQLKKMAVDNLGRGLPRDWTLYKLEAFQQDPADSLLLGDSRAAGMFSDRQGTLSTSEVTTTSTGIRLFNFGIRGGDSQTSWDAFELARQSQTLKKVFVQVGFHNSGTALPIAEGPLAIVRQPLLYFFDSYVGRVAFRLIYWRYQLRHLPPGGFTISEAQSNELSPEGRESARRNLEIGLHRGANSPRCFANFEAIAQSCKSNGIQVMFINMPMSPAAHQVIKDLDREADYATFKSRLAALGTFMDFDRPDERPFTEENFKDVLHLKDGPIKAALMEEIFHGANK